MLRRYHCKTPTDYKNALSFSTSYSGNYPDFIPVPNFGNTPGKHVLYARAFDRHKHAGSIHHSDSIQLAGVLLEELEGQSGCSIAPDPLKEVLNVDPKKNKKMRFILFDETGQCVLDKSVSKPEEFDMKTFARGTYTIFVWKEKQKIYRTTLRKL